MITLVLVYVFYNQFRKLDESFRHALGKQGQFNGDFSAFRRRHRTTTIFQAQTPLFRFAVQIVVQLVV